MLLLAVCLVYSNSLANGFHFDDFHTVTDNPAVRSVRNLRRIFTDTTAFSVLPANQTYRPVVTASLALDYATGAWVRSALLSPEHDVLVPRLGGATVLAL